MSALHPHEAAVADAEVEGLAVLRAGTSGRTTVTFLTSVCRVVMDSFLGWKLVGERPSCAGRARARSVRRPGRRGRGRAAARCRRGSRRRRARRSPGRAAGGVQPLDRPIRRPQHPGVLVHDEAALGVEQGRDDLHRRVRRRELGLEERPAEPVRGPPRATAAVLASSSATRRPAPGRRARARDVVGPDQGPASTVCRKSVKGRQASWIRLSSTIQPVGPGRAADDGGVLGVAGGLVAEAPPVSRRCTPPCMTVAQPTSVGAARPAPPWPW